MKPATHSLRSHGPDGGVSSPPLFVAPTEADSSRPTVLDVTAMDTPSEGDSLDNKAEFAEHDGGVHDEVPVEIPVPRGRRLVLIGGGGQSQRSPAHTEQDPRSGPVEDSGARFHRSPAEINAAFRSLDAWYQEEMSQNRAHVMKTVIFF